MINIEELVSEARAHLQKSENDKKWCRNKELIALLEAGATPIEINQEQIGEEGYSHMVSYEGITFFNDTMETVQELKKYKTKK